jgi:two-component system nitrogen regulation response regulator NtrX
VKDSLLQKNITANSGSYENVLSYPLKEAREKFEKDYLTSQLKKHKGNISKTAEFIGMERSALHRKLKTLGIKDIN